MNHTYSAELHIRQHDCSRSLWYQRDTGTLKQLPNLQTVPTHTEVWWVSQREREGETEGGRDRGRERQRERETEGETDRGRDRE